MDEAVVQAVAAAGAARQHRHAERPVGLEARRQLVAGRLPFHEPERLVVLSRDASTPGNYLDLRAQTTAFAYLAERASGAASGPR